MNDQVKISMVAFGFAFIAYMLYQQLTRDAAWSGGAVVGQSLIAIVLGAVVGAIAYFVSSKMNG